MHCLHESFYEKLILGSVFEGNMVTELKPSQWSISNGNAGSTDTSSSEGKKQASHQDCQLSVAVY